MKAKKHSTRISVSSAEIEREELSDIFWSMKVRPRVTRIDAVDVDERADEARQHDAACRSRNRKSSSRCGPSRIASRHAVLAVDALVHLQPAQPHGMELRVERAAADEAEDRRVEAPTARRSAPTATACGRPKSVGQVGQSHAHCGLVHFLDLGRPDLGRALQRVVQAEGRLRHEHRVAVKVIGDGEAVGGDELVELLRVVAGNPAHHLIARRLEADRHAIFIGQPVRQHVELQRADDADDGGRAVRRDEELHDALLRQLLQRLAQLLGLHRVAELHAAQDFRREARHAA